MRRRFGYLLIVIATGLGAVGTAGPAQATFPGQNGRIAFESTLAQSAGALTPLDHAFASGTKSPSPREAMGMAYDAAHDEVVLFGGDNPNELGETWTWDGKTWTLQHPATSPSARWGMGMTYDAAHGEVVLFGGAAEGSALHETWTWDGTTWTQQHPVTSPPGRDGMGMVYDSSRAEVVLFGGAPDSATGTVTLDDTWAWEGATWTHLQPATSPPARGGMGMTYDAARGKVVLFAGFSQSGGVHVDDTWTWDGTNWTQQHPATSPLGRDGMGMVYDSSRAEVVLFGGAPDSATGTVTLDDTWAWEGATWTQRHPATSPSARLAMGMAYDPSRAEATLFGGFTGHVIVGDTWTWDGAAWRVPFTAHLHLSPASGPPGTAVQATGTGFAAFEHVRLTFHDSINGKTALGSFSTDATGHLKAQVTIPANATVGPQEITAAGKVSRQKAKATFTVT